jgi:O-antigen/teichoic acid export membrane protein
MSIKELLSRPIATVRHLHQSPLTSHAAWMMSGSFFQAGSAFAANLLLARLLLPQDFGKFALIQANVSLIGVIVSFQIGDLLLRTSEEKLDSKYLSICAGGLAIQTFLVGGGTLILLRTCNLLSLQSGILLVALLASGWINLQMRLYERTFDYKRLSWLETSSHFSAHLFSVVGALMGLGSIVLYLREAVRLIFLVVGLRCLGGWQKIPLSWLRIGDWKFILAQIRGFWTDGVLEQLFSRWVVMLVGTITGEQGTGYFFQAQRLAILPHQFLQPLTERIAFNYFSHRVSKNHQQKELLKSLGLTAGVLILIAGLASLFANSAIPFVFGQQWQPVGSILIALLGFMVGLTLFGMLKSYFMAQAKMRTFMIFGRGGQYMAIALAVLIVMNFKVNPLVSMALGVSGSYILGTLLLLGVILTNRSKEKVNSNLINIQ